jgi:hypothetical protein
VSQQKVEIESSRLVEHLDGSIEGGSFASIGSSLQQWSKQTS